MTTYTTANADATRELGRTIGERLPDRVIVTLTGNLGSGKTTFLQGLVAARTADSVSSPTYVYHQRYGTTVQPIDHFDLYRVHQNPALLDRTGIQDYTANVPGWLLIEWPVDDLVYPTEVPRLTIEASGAPDYRFVFTATDPSQGTAAEWAFGSEIELHSSENVQRRPHFAEASRGKQVACPSVALCEGGQPNETISGRNAIRRQSPEAVV